MSHLTRATMSICTAFWFKGPQKGDRLKQMTPLIDQPLQTVLL